MGLILRLVKGTPLTFAEGDANLTYLEGLITGSNNLFSNWTGSTTSVFAGTASYATNANMDLNKFATTGSNLFLGNQIISGTLEVINGITSSLQGTSSWAVSSSWAPTPVTTSYALQAVSASYALTASISLNVTGIINYIPRFTNTNILENSQIRDNGTLVGIGMGGTTGNKLSVNGYIYTTDGNGYYGTMIASNGGWYFSNQGNSASKIGNVFSYFNSRVAIGTTTDAAYQLDVNGTVRIGTMVLTGTATNRISIGGSTTGNSSVALGSASTAALQAIAIGEGATAVQGSLAIGRGATTLSQFQVVFGGPNTRLSNYYLGRGIYSNIIENITIQPTAASGSINTSGSNFSIYGGGATGNATGGSVIFLTSDTAVSGSAIQSFSERMRITSGSILITGSINVSSIINLTPQNPLPIGITGSLAASGSALFFHDGINWRQISLL